MKIPDFLNPNNIAPNFDYDPGKWEYCHGGIEATWGDCEFWCDTTCAWVTCAGNTGTGFIHRRPLKKETWVYVEPKNVKVGDQQLENYRPTSWKTVTTTGVVALDFPPSIYRRKVSE